MGKKNIKDRVIAEANYILETQKTIREVAKKFEVCKSTVHKDLSERLQEYDLDLYEKVDLLLKDHLAIRHIRGGEVTKERYKKKKEK